MTALRTPDGRTAASRRGMEEAISIAESRHLKYLPPVHINTLARLFTRYLSEFKVHKQLKPSKTVLLYKKGELSCEQPSNSTTKSSPFDNDVIIDVKRGLCQSDTISPKIFSAALENLMRGMEWDDMGVKVNRRHLHYLRFADDIVLITTSINQAERMLAEFS
ncbi:hypothetical protein RB195_013990 [Necator americanus]|uniref:Reverse transcriptase domain-containing protein n=1 Tax=Necator americanus TaxID=51031 RepID=A0ABR1DY30_NECAM